MTDEELKELVASIAISQRETDRLIRGLQEGHDQIAQQHREIAQQHKELAALFAQRDAEREKERQEREKEKLERDARCEREKAEREQEKLQREKEREKEKQEYEKEKREILRQIKENNKLIVGISNKFGSFTEGLIYPSMEKILRKQFKMEFIAPNVKKEDKNGILLLELDIFAYANTTINRVCIVEIKSHLNEKELDSMLQTLDRFRVSFPEHSDKELIGIIAYIHGHQGVVMKAHGLGLHLCHIQDDIFKLVKTVRGFKPRNFNTI